MRASSSAAAASRFSGVQVRLINIAHLYLREFASMSATVRSGAEVPLL